MNRFALLAAAALAAAATLICVPHADAAPIPHVTMTATADGPTSGETNGATVFFDVTVTGDPVTDATLTAVVPGNAENAVSVDHVTAAPGTVDTANDKPGTTTVTARVGTGASALTGGVLAAGKHEIGFSTSLQGLRGDASAVSATFSYTDANGSRQVASKTTIPLPDLSIATSSYGAGRDGLAVSPGGEYFVTAEVRNRGPKVQASTLTITLPDGLHVSSDEGIVRFDDKSGDETDVTCTKASATELRCPFGAVDGEVEVALDLDASTTAKPGTRGTLALHIEAGNGLDATPADNTTSTAVRVVPPARLRTSLTAADTSVEVGSKRHLTATVTNEGTEPVSVFGVVVVSNDLDAEDETAKKKEHFEITAFTGREGFPDRGGSEGGSEGGSAPVPAAGAMPALVTLGGGSGSNVMAMARQAASADDDDELDDPNVRFWNIGTLAPGATIKAVATIRAKSVGRSEAVAVASGISNPSSCVVKADNEAAALRCPEVDKVTLRAVAGAGTNGNGTLAATGLPTTQLTLLGCALLLLGGLSLYAGSPRSRVIGRHRT